MPGGSNASRDLRWLLGTKDNSSHNADSGSSFNQARLKLDLPQQNDFPLRILVQSDMVGAIIGKSGSTIKQITQQSQARIDVHREENLDQQEKVITINGTPESCSTACFKIIEIILNERSRMNKNFNSNCLNSPSSAEDNSTNTGSNNIISNGINSSPNEVQLRILAHNNLIGRLIGRSGASIKRIMQQTSTKINISVNSLTDCTNERTISVLGTLDQVRHAEQVISSKLRAAYQADMNFTLTSVQAMNQRPYLFNNVPISYMPGPYMQNPILSNLVSSQPGHSGPGMSRAMPVAAHQSQITGPSLYPGSPGYLSLYPNINVPPSGFFGFNPVSALEVEKEVVNIYIPDTMVGAMIGKSGSAIKEMINSSGASIKVAAAPNLSEPVFTNPSKEEGSPSQQQKREQPPNPDPTDDSISESTPSTESTQDSQKHDTNPQSTNKQHSNPKPSYAPNRKVTIVGTPESLWSAQYLIYRKVSIETGKSDISLMVEIQVPSQLVGKIIGKGGVTVKQIQKQTKTTIRLPDEKPSNQSDTNNEVMTPLQITGEFQCSQLAQRHIKNLLRDSQYSSRQTNNNKSHQSKNNENSSTSKSNAQQTNFNDNHRHRSDNESISTPDDIYDESNRTNGKCADIDGSAPDDKQNDDENPAQEESPSQIGNIDENSQGDKSQLSSQTSSTENAKIDEDDNPIISNNNTINKNLNSTTQDSSEKEYLAESDQNDNHEGCKIENSEQAIN